MDTFGSPVYPVSLPTRPRLSGAATGQTQLNPALAAASGHVAIPRPDGLENLRILRGAGSADAPAGVDGLRMSLSHQWTIVGTKGSGKTTMARMLLHRYQELWRHVSIYVLDSKVSGDFDGWPGVRTGDSAPDLIGGADGGIQVWQPELGSLSEYDVWLRKILRGHDRTRPALILIDELSSVAPSRDKYPDGLDLVMKQGRGKAVCIVALTQNGVNIPPNVLGQTTHVARFRLNSNTDARRVDGLLWRDGHIREPDERHGFHYKRLDTPADAPLVFKDARQLFG